MEMPLYSMRTENREIIFLVGLIAYIYEARSLNAFLGQFSGFRSVLVCLCIRLKTELKTGQHLALIIHNSTVSYEELKMFECSL